VIFRRANPDIDIPAGADIAGGRCYGASMSVDRAPDSYEWDPWSPAEVAERLDGCPCLWGVAGGWAVDLWLGRRTRPHGDIEIMASRSALAAVLDRFPGLHFYVAQDGGLTRLEEGRAGAARQVWVLDPVAGAWRLDVMLDPGDEVLWVYRRDPRIYAPRALMIGRSQEGIPYMAPEGVLLFKGRAPRPKDEWDLARCLPRLPAAGLEWLRRALATAHPDSPWIGRLLAAGGSGSPSPPSCP
jgi:hypothetical protein